LIPNTMGNPEANPNWRNKLYPGVAGAQQAEDLQYDDTSIVGQMKRNAGYY